MRVAVKNHALPVYKKNRIAPLLCIFENTICIYKICLVIIVWEMGTYKQQISDNRSVFPLQGMMSESNKITHYLCKA